MTPRGIRNQNPGNIRRDATQWQGMAADQSDPYFVVFESPLWGIRAIAKILESYRKEGLTTIRQIINRWAPPSENDTDAYVKAVAAHCEVGADSPFDFDHMTPLLVEAIIQHENGEQPYTDVQVQAGVQLA